MEEAWDRYRTAHGSSELIPLQWIDGLYAVDIAEVVCRIENPIADIFKQVAMISAAAAPRNDVDDAACVLTILGVVVVGLNTELL